MKDIKRIARDLADKYIATYDPDSRYEVYIAGFHDGHAMAQTSLEANHEADKLLLMRAEDEIARLKSDLATAVECLIKLKGGV